MKDIIPQYNHSANITLVCAVKGHNVLVNGSTFNGTINGTIPDKCIVHHEPKTMYGYEPNLAANVVGAALFFIILIAQLGLGAVTREWWMLVSWGITAALELVTYIGRSIAHKYPRSLPMFEMQLVCSIIAPAFMAAGLYYLLGKQITLYGEQYSFIPPMIYTAIFTTADVISLVIQGVGGGIAASDLTGPYGPAKGGWIMVGGIAFQVLVLSMFIIFWGMVNWRIFRDDSANWDPKFAENRARPLFKYFFPAVCISILFLQTRSVYRIVELSVGWTGYIMHTERYFLIVDGLMIVFGMLALCIIHPGIACGYVPIRGLNYRPNQLSPLERGTNDSNNKHDSDSGSNVKETATTPTIPQPESV